MIVVPCSSSKHNPNRPSMNRIMIWAGSGGISSTFCIGVCNDLILLEDFNFSCCTTNCNSCKSTDLLWSRSINAMNSSQSFTFVTTPNRVNVSLNSSAVTLPSWFRSNAVNKSFIDVNSIPNKVRRFATAFSIDRTNLDMNIANRPPLYICFLNSFSG